MKIAVVGNLGQNGYMITKALRELGHQVDLFITCKNNNIPSTQDPANYEQNYSHPSWVKIYDTSNQISAFFVGRNIFSQYDRVIAITLSPAYIQFFNKDFISIATGSDLREFVFQNGIYNFLLKKAYQKTKHLFYLNPDHQSAIKKLNLESKSTFLPYPMEIDKFNYLEANQKQNEKLTVFWPTAWSTRLKGMDKFINACTALFNQGFDFNLQLVDHTNNDAMEKKDKNIMLDFIKKYQKNITVFQPIKNKEEIFKQYYQADIVADQFQIGSFGLVTAEAMCCKKPVMIYFDNDYAKYYNNEAFPGLICQTSQEIADVIKKYINNQNELKIVGKISFAWIKKYHFIQAIGKKINNVL